MKRKIKFRGKNLKDKKWNYGSLVFDYDNKPMILVAGYSHTGSAFSGCHNVIPETVGQFTGIKDCNDNEIYDGDIITVKGIYHRVVLWDKMMWALMPTEYYHDEVFWKMNLQHPGTDWWEEYADELEVIGNIHDNPEFIK